MKLIATKTGTAGEMMLTEQNPYERYKGEYTRMGCLYDGFEESKFSMLTDDPTIQEGQEVDREEYEVVEQLSFVDEIWIDKSLDITLDYCKFHDIPTRQILRRETNLTIDGLLRLTAFNGGKIVSTASLSTDDIAQARASNRMYIDEGSLGYVWISEAVAEKQAGEWVSVEERLPEDGGRYWCYVEEVNDLGLSHYQWNCSFHEIEKRWADENHNIPLVTHWMPLPSAPQTKP